MRLLIILLALFFLGCSNSEKSKNNTTQKNPATSPAKNTVIKQTEHQADQNPNHSLENQLPPAKEKADTIHIAPSKSVTPKNPPKKEDPCIMHPSEISMRPMDKHYNGAVYLNHFILDSTTYQANPDTLKEIIKSEYLLFKDSYPVSIADNFEKGISTEHVHYPTLNYKALLYHNNCHCDPYDSKRFTVFMDKQKDEVLVQ